MNLRMLAPFKNLQPGQVITAPDDKEFVNWLITRKYAEPVTEEVTREKKRAALSK